ncbi:hypothetical protein ABIE20_003125 [Pseudomonas sp. 2835]
MPGASRRDFYLTNLGLPLLLAAVTASRMLNTWRIAPVLRLPTRYRRDLLFVVVAFALSTTVTSSPSAIAGRMRANCWWRCCCWGWCLAPRVSCRAGTICRTPSGQGFSSG